MITKRHLPFLFLATLLIHSSGWAQAGPFFNRSHDLINGREGIWKIEARFRLKQLHELLPKLRAQGLNPDFSSMEEGGISPDDMNAHPLHQLMLYSYEEINHTYQEMLRVLAPELSSKDLQELQKPIATQFYFKLLDTEMVVAVDANQIMANEFREKQLDREGWLLGGAAALGTAATQYAWNGREFYQSLDDVAEATGRGAWIKNNVWRPWVANPGRNLRQGMRAGWQGLRSRVRSPRAYLLLAIPVGVGLAVKGLHEGSTELFSRDITDPEAATPLYNPWTDDGDIEPANLLFVTYEEVKYQAEHDPEFYAACSEDAAVLRDYEGRDLVHTFDIYGLDALFQELDELENPRKLKKYVDEREAWLVAEVDYQKRTSRADYEELVSALMEILQLSREQVISRKLFGSTFPERVSTAIRQYLQNCTLPIKYKRTISDENRLKWKREDLGDMRVDWESLKDNQLVQTHSRNWFRE